MTSENLSDAALADVGPECAKDGRPVDLPAMERLTKGQGHSRRSFLMRMAAAGIGAAALSLLDFPGGRNSTALGAPPDNNTFPNIPGSTLDAQVLNFALTLEILEADLYRQALNKASGFSATAALSANPATYRLAVPSRVPSGATAAGYKYLVDFAYVEAAHRDFLRAALISLGEQRAQPNAHGYQFLAALPSNLGGILAALIPLEETGVRAYLGALPFLDDGDLATVAASIYSTEARHSAALRYVVKLDPGPVHFQGDQLVIQSYPSDNTLEYFLNPPDVISRVTPLFV